MDKIKLILPTRQNHVNYIGNDIASRLAAVEIVSKIGEGTPVTMIENQATSDEI